MDTDLDATPEPECEADPDCARGRLCIQSESRAAVTICDDNRGCASQSACSNDGRREQRRAANADRTADATCVACCRLKASSRDAEMKTATDCRNDPNQVLAGWYFSGFGGTTYPVEPKQVKAWA